MASIPPQRLTGRALLGGETRHAGTRRSQGRGGHSGRRDLGPQRGRVMIVLPDKRPAMYDLAGDALYMDAHILKWHPWVNLLGLHTSYELDRVAGRYNEVSDERGKPHTAYELARPAGIDLFSIARRHLL